MIKRKLLISICAFIVICAGIMRFVLSPKRETVAYHVERLGQLRVTAAWKSEPDRTGTANDFMRPQVWFWYLRGAPSLSKIMQEREEHQQALIQLGYFERREFTFTTRTQWYADFRGMMSNTVFADTNWWFHLDTSKPQSVLITASKKDIPKFEQIVSKLNSGQTQ